MKNDVKEWFETVERLRYAGAVWAEDELPAAIKQTHISVILLGKRRVLKLKKPVDFGFLDYTTLEKRRLACESEIALNRRLCPEIYLAAQPVVEDGEGNLSFDGEGRIIEYGVLMKRLPEERMLERMMAENTVTEAMISRVAEKLAAFHRAARRGPDVDAYGSLETVRFNWEENFEQTEPFVGRTISRADFDLIRQWADGWLEENKVLLRERVERGRICDGHGDVRCESVAVTDGICIFDCIEFNERFRCADVANEAAFLAMDLDAFGRPDLGYFFFEQYAEKAGDEQIFDLYAFYRCYRAFVRGKVLSFQTDEPEVSAEKRELAARRAAKYFRLASGAARPLRTPVVILTAGLSGTGKTSVARALAAEFGLRVVSSDAVRASLFGEDKKPSDYGKEAYDARASRRTYQKMLEKGMELFGRTGGVILDATFQRAEDRETVRNEAEKIGAECFLIECRSPEETVRRRIRQRQEKKDGLSDAGWEIYERQKAEFEPVAGRPEKHLAIDTEKDLPAIRDEAARWLRDGGR